MLKEAENIFLVPGLLLTRELGEADLVPGVGLEVGLDGPRRGPHPVLHQHSQSHRAKVSIEGETFD